MKTKMANMNRAMMFVENSERELAKLDGLIGMEEYKKTMRQIMGLQKRKVFSYIKGIDTRPVSYDMCFLGNPGTGKTTICHKTAELFYRAGIVSSDKLMIAGRSDLVGEHVGETALKTKKLLEKASGHVLLIDEAYSLLDDRDGSFGDESINTLVEIMENCRGKQVLVFAGYRNKMQQFLDKNPGLRSRIPYTVHFEDYSSEQLYHIAEQFAREDDCCFHPDVHQKLLEIFDYAKEIPEFGNARYARNLIEQAESRRCESIDFLEMMQLYGTNPIQLMPEDFEPIITDKPSKPRRIGFL